MTTAHAPSVSFLDALLLAPTDQSRSSRGRPSYDDVSACRKHFRIKLKEALITANGSILWEEHDLLAIFDSN
jgi:hypothetical protein